MSAKPMSAVGGRIGDAARGRADEARMRLGRRRRADVEGHAVIAVVVGGHFHHQVGADDVGDRAGDRHVDRGQRRIGRRGHTGLADLGQLTEVDRVERDRVRDRVQRDGHVRRTHRLLHRHVHAGHAGGRGHRVVAEVVAAPVLVVGGGAGALVAAGSRVHCDRGHVGGLRERGRSAAGRCAVEAVREDAIENVGRAADGHVVDVRSGDDTGTVCDAAGLRRIGGLCEHRHRIGRAVEQRRGEGEAAIRADRKIVATVLLQHEAAAGEPTDVATDRIGRGRRAGHLHAGHIGSCNDATAVRNGARLQRAARLSRDGDRVRRAIAQRRGEREAAVRRERQVVAAVLLQHQTAADQATERAADRISRRRCRTEIEEVCRALRLPLRRRPQP